jgi:hypothetical protein
VGETKEDLMRITLPMLRTIARIWICLVLASAAIVAPGAITAVAQKSALCPPIIASLLPKNSSIRGGQYNASGPMGIGSGAADLPFDHPCIKSEKYPARVSIAITYYSSEMAEILKMQGDAANEQTLMNAMDEFKRSKRTPRREKLPGGEIVYVDFTTECPAEGAAGTGTASRPPIPNVKLKGVALTATVRMEITIEGKISTDLAKAAAAEVFDNLKKANFEKAK